MNSFLSRTALVIVASAILLPPLSAQQSGERMLPVSFKVIYEKALRSQPRMVVGNYPVSFVVGGEATGVGSGFGTKAQLTVALEGISEADMRLLANEAYADLVARLTKAGIDVAPVADLNAHDRMKSLARAPGNMETDRGIMDSRAKKAVVTFGSDAAPLIKGMGDISGRGAYGANGAYNKASADLNATILTPKLILDFLDLDANKMGARDAKVGGSYFFSIDPMSGGSVLAGSSKGPAGGGFWPKGSVASPVPLRGSAAQNVARPVVNIASILGTARVDAFRADRAGYMEQVRAAYRGYNQAVADMVVKARSGGK